MDRRVPRRSAESVTEEETLHSVRGSGQWPQRRLFGSERPERGPRGRLKVGTAPNRPYGSTGSHRTFRNARRLLLSRWLSRVHALSACVAPAKENSIFVWGRSTERLPTLTQSPEHLLPFYLWMDSMLGCSHRREVTKRCTSEWLRGITVARS